MIIKHAILHVLDKDAGNLIAAQGELELTTPGVHDYIERVVTKFEKTDFKVGELTGTDFLAKLIGDDNDLSFTDKTTQLAEKLFDVMDRSDNIPAGDALFFEYAEGTDDYFGMIKLNFAPRYSHVVDYVDDTLVNNLVINQAILPGANQRPLEGLIINLMTGQYRLLEKQYLIEGHRQNYLSSYVLELDPDLSTSDTIKQIKRRVTTVADKFDVPEYDALAKLQNALFEDTFDSNHIDVNELPEKVFSNNVSAKAALKELLVETDINPIVEVNNSDRIEQKTSTVSLSISGGIKLQLPIDVYGNSDLFEIVSNTDGTSTVQIKDVDSIINKFN